jgi:hypothetical protein
VGGGLGLLACLALLILLAAYLRKRRGPKKSTRTINAVFVNPLAEYDPSMPEGIETASDEMAAVPAYATANRLMTNSNYYQSAYPGYALDDQDGNYSFLPGNSEA